MTRPLVVAFAFVTAGLGSASAQCPDWQSGFEPRGIDGAITAMCLHDDGTGPDLYLAGGFRTAITVKCEGIARWDGTSFSALPGVTFGTIYTLASFDDGGGSALYAAGTFLSIGGVPADNVAKWDGATWSPLGQGLGAQVYALQVYDDGSGPALYAAGEFLSSGGTPMPGVARWDGANWHALGSGLSGANGRIGFALTVHDDGGGPALFVGGAFDAAGGVASRSLARWRNSTWSAVGSGVDGTNSSVHVLGVHNDGSGAKLVVGGDFDGASGIPAQSVALWNGSSWSALGSGLSDGTVSAFLSLPVGATHQLLACGSFRKSGAAFANGIVRWNGSSWTALGGGFGRNLHWTAAAMATYDAGAGPELYLGGYFERVGGTIADQIARWNGSTWSALHTSNGIGGTVLTLLAHDDGHGPALFAAGDFDNAGATIDNGIARWDGTSWRAVGNAAAVFGDYKGITQLCAFGGDLYAAGTFDASTGAAFENIARWDGTSWSDVGGGANGLISALVVHDDGTGSALWVVGSFSEVAGIPAPAHLARWNGTSWTPWGAAVPNGSVLALASYDDGTGSALYATGYFSSVGAVQASRIAKWNGLTWSALGTGLTGGVTLTGPRALAVFDDGSGSALYVTGSFTMAGGVLVNGIARWNGNTWSRVGNGGGGLIGVGGGQGGTSFAVHDDGSGPALYLGGNFGTVETTFAQGIARWNGTTWSALGNGVFGVRALASFDSGAGPKLAAGGALLGIVTDTLASGIAMWEACDTGPTTYCVGDGSGAACPCSNTSPLGAGEGCLNSLGRGGRLRGLGTSSVSNDHFVLHANQLANGPGLYFQATAETAAVPFGDGLRCTGGTIRRLGIVQSVEGSSVFPAQVGVSIAQVGGIPFSGGVRSYQVWYRNVASFCAIGAFNMTNGITATWTP